MSKTLLRSDRLNALLTPQGFWLREVDRVTKTMAFVRSSLVAPLYEHLNIEAQGKNGEAVYATTAVSGSTNHSWDECISQTDNELLFALETDRERHWTLVRTRQEAEEWENRLAQAADLHCKATALSQGPLLLERLQPAFSALDRYIAKLANLKGIFASEFRYFQEAPARQRSEAEQLAERIGDIHESCEDVRLACLVIFLFAPAVEGRESAFLGKKWDEDPALRVRVYLLVDYLREQRKRHEATWT